MKITLFISTLFIVCLLSGCQERLPTAESSLHGESDSMKGGEMTIQDGEHLTVQSTVGDVIAHPAFDGFGQFLLPLERRYDETMPLHPCCLTTAT